MGCPVRSAVDLDAPAFPPGSIIRHLARERVLLLYGPTATVLQVAHPLVAAGVRDHSSFESDPLARLHRTLDAVYAITFGTRRDAAAAAGGIARLHARVRGTLEPGSVESPAPDERYSAADPELLLWVSATLIACAIEAYERFVRPLSEAELEAYHEQSRAWAAYFGLSPRYGPQSYGEFDAYYRDTLASERLGSHPVSRSVAARVATPLHPMWARPLGLPVRLVLGETLPPGVRERLGFRSTSTSRAAWRGASATVRAALPRVPGRVRYMPAYFDALAREGAGARER